MSTQVKCLQCETPYHVSHGARCPHCDAINEEIVLVNDEEAA